MIASTIFLQLAVTVGAGILLRKTASHFPGGPQHIASLRVLLNRLTLWVTMPALVFQTVATSPLSPQLIQAPAISAASMACTGAIAWLLLARRYGRTPETGALVLAASAGSVSFMGIPLVRAVLGPEQAATAVYFALLNVPLALIAGAVISCRIGATPEASRTAPAPPARVARQALRQLLVLPATWALVAGLVLNGWALPGALTLALHTSAASLAPMTMFALGLGLQFQAPLARYRMVFPAAIIKLAVSPLVVLACGWVLGLSGTSLAAVSLQGAMPTQVLSVVVAERYRLDARLVGLTLAIDTALAFLLLPLLIAGSYAMFGL